MQELFCVFLYIFVRTGKRRAEERVEGVWGEGVEDGEALAGQATPSVACWHII